MRLPVLLITLFLTMALYPVTPLYAASPDVEEQRLSKARTANAEMVTRYQVFAGDLAEGLTVANTQAMRSALVTRIARALWQRAVTDSASGFADDRALYWGRLALRVSLRAELREHNSELETLLSLLEYHSRGFADIHFPDNGTQRILIKAVTASYGS